MLVSLVALVLACTARAQFLPITANHIVNSANQPYNGRVCFTPTYNGAPLNFYVAGGQQATGATACFNVSSGVMQTGVELADVAVSSPAYFCYRVSLRNGADRFDDAVLYQCYQPSSSAAGSNILDNAVPGAYGASLIQTGPRGAQGVPGPVGPMGPMGAVIVYDVRNYGAVAGAADATAAFQAAINAASAAGGSVYVPEGTWNLTGPIQSACDAILCIPTVADSSPPQQVRIFGSTKMRQDASSTHLVNTGTIIKTSVIGADTQAAIIGVPKVSSNQSGNFDNIDLYVRDITFFTYPNPQIGCINAKNAAGASFQYLSCGTGENYAPNTHTQPTYATTGFDLPTISNDTLAELKFSEITGYWFGIYTSEHAYLLMDTISNGKFGVYVDQGFHTAHFDILQAQEVGTPIVFANGPSFVDMTNLDIETDAANYDGCASWCYTGTDIQDASNFAHGVITAKKTQGGLGNTSSPVTVVGGAHLNVYDEYNNNWTMQSITATVLANNQAVTFAAGAALNTANGGLLYGCFQGLTCSPSFGSVEIKTGSTPTAGDLFSISFATAYPRVLQCTIHENDANTTRLTVQWDFNNASASSASFYSVGVPAPNTQYGFTYSCGN